MAGSDQHGIFMVNPGSPTAFEGRGPGTLGHVAVVEIADGVAMAPVIDLGAP